MRSRRNHVYTAAKLAATAASLVALVTACGNAGNGNQDDSQDAAASQPADNGQSGQDTSGKADGTTTSGGDAITGSGDNFTAPNSKTWPEIAGNHKGVNLYSSPNGSTPIGVIKYGTTVNVQCWAPNNSGMASADPGFYRFTYLVKGKKTTVYAIANTFTNGDPLGSAGTKQADGTIVPTNIDPKVQSCKTQ